GLILLYVLALRTGASYALEGMSSYDTCWILKFGAIMCDNIVAMKYPIIPPNDPFTFTAALMAGKGDSAPFVLYHWMSEILLYKAFTYGTPFLLIAAAIMGTVTSIIIPLRLCKSANIAAVWSFFAIAVLVTTQNIRSLIRPEIFTALFISIFYLILFRHAS